MEFFGFNIQRKPRQMQDNSSKLNILENSVTEIKTTCNNRVNMVDTLCNRIDAMMTKFEDFSLNMVKTITNHESRIQQTEKYAGESKQEIITELNTGLGRLEKQITKEINEVKNVIEEHKNETNEKFVEINHKINTLETAKNTIQKIMYSVGGVIALLCWYISPSTIEKIFVHIANLK